MQLASLDDLILPEHPIRPIWQIVNLWPMDQFLKDVKARQGCVGRDLTDPRVLLTLWLYATTRNIASGREIERLCRTDLVFQWICGGLSLNHHTINDFRVAHEAAMDDLLTQMLATLTKNGVVKVQRITQDGTKVRASAGKNSFKTRDTLEEHLRQARRHLEDLKKVANDPTASAQRQAAQRWAAKERVVKLEQTIEEVKKIEQAKQQQKDKPSKKNPAMASETDPQARKMKMPDGGTRPAYNVQLAEDSASRVVIGLDVTNAGNDVHESEPMRRQVEQRTGQKVQEHLMDGGYVGLESIDRAAATGTMVYAPVPEARNEKVDRYAAKKTDSAAVADWRRRMSTEEAKTKYKERAALAETVNAELKTYRGMGRFVVRGLKKVKCMVLLSVLAYNLVHAGWALLG